MQKRSIGIALSYTYTFLNMACSLVLSAFLLKQLGDVEYGLYQTVTAFAMYLVMLEFGTATVMGRNVSICRGRGDEYKLKQNISTIWYITIGLSAVIVLVSLVFCANIGNIYKNTMTAEQVSYSEKIFLITTAYLVFSFLLNTLNGLLLGMENYTYANIMKIAKVVTRTLLLVVCIIAKPYAFTIVAVDLVVSISIFIITFIYCKKTYCIELKIRYFDKSILVDALPLAFALLLQTIINQANSSVGKFIISIKLSLETVALYSVAQYIYSLISSITTIPISMYLPQIAKDVSNGVEGKEFAKTLVPSSRLVVIISGTVLLGFFAVGRQFIEIFYGASKIEAWIYALVIVVPMFVNMTNGAIINVLDVKNKRLTRSLSLLFTTVLNIIITVALISHIGIWAAVIGTSVSLVLGNIIVMNIYYYKVLDIDVLFLYKEAYKGLLPFQCLAGVVAFIVAQIIDNVYLSFFIGGGLYVVVLAFLIIRFGLNDAEKIQLSKIAKKMGIKKHI